MTSQLERIQKALNRNTVKGITAARLASLTKTPLDSVHKRIYDLRKAGARITSTVQKVRGERRVVYKAA